MEVFTLSVLAVAAYLAGFISALVFAVLKEYDWW